MSNLKPKDIDFEIASRTFEYCPDSGEFTWLPRIRDEFVSDQSFNRWNSIFSGKPAFTNINAKGYAQAKVWGNRYLAHRVAWVLHYGRPPEFWIDHINGNRCDNRICNLRDVNPTQNGYNRSKNRNNTSGVKGVSYDKRHSKWKVRITMDGKCVNLGQFDLFDDAVSCYYQNYKLFHGEYGRVSWDV